MVCPCGSEIEDDPVILVLGSTSSAWPTNWDARMLYEVNPHRKKGKHIGQPVARINTPIQDLIDLRESRDGDSIIIYQ